MQDLSDSDKVVANLMNEKLSQPEPESIKPKVEELIVEKKKRVRKIKETQENELQEQ